jgi:hypothetical protein
MISHTEILSDEDVKLVYITVKLTYSMSRSPDVWSHTLTRSTLIEVMQP